MGHVLIFTFPPAFAPRHVRRAKGRAQRQRRIQAELGRPGRDSGITMSEISLGWRGIPHYWTSTRIIPYSPSFPRIHQLAPVTSYAVVLAFPRFPPHHLHYSSRHHPFPASFQHYYAAIEVCYRYQQHRHHRTSLSGSQQICREFSP